MHKAREGRAIDHDGVLVTIAIKPRCGLQRESRGSRPAGTNQFFCFIGEVVVAKVTVVTPIGVRRHFGNLAD